MKNIAIIGSGIMGNGIAHTVAQNNFQVSLVDINQQALIKAIETINVNLDRQLNKGIISLAIKVQTLENIRTFTDIKEAVTNADLVIEATTENIDTKLSLFKELDKLCKQETILASNTSSKLFCRLRP